MAAKVEDRRVQRTRKLLQDALIALILEKGYEAVTVQDIIDRANVGRSTFYTHFLDKQQLLLSRLEELHAHLAQHHPPVATTGELRLSFSLAMFEHAQNYRQVYRALLGKQSGAVVFKRVQQMLTVLIHGEVAALATRAGTTILPIEVVVTYTVNAFLGLLSWWVDNEQHYSPQQMDAIFTQLTMPGVLAGIGDQTQQNRNIHTLPT